MGMSKFMRGGIGFGTQNIDKLFTPSIQFNANARYKQEDIDKILKLRDARPITQDQISANRSWLDRGLDFLLMSNYAVAGAINGAIRDDNTLFQGMSDGFKAGNPFGAGYEAGEVTFSDVFESAGWKDDAFWGSNVLRGTTGFVFDVLLDPTTYMTFGLGALAKGTGHVGKATQTLVGLTKQFPEFAEGIQKAGGLTDDLAEEIVKRANGIKSSDEIAENIADIGKVDRTNMKLSGEVEGVKQYKISRAQLNQEVQELKSTYNKLIGVGREGKGITIGVQNMPFGDWVAKKVGIKAKPATLVPDKTIRAFSDGTGISGLYATGREAFYGGKLGSLFSRNASLKKLAEAEPAKLFEYISAVNKLQGKDLDKLARERSIKELGQSLLHLSPAEQKKVIEALENPSLWQKAKDIVRGAESSAWTKLHDDYEQVNQEVLERAKTMRELRDDYATASDEQLKVYQDELARIKQNSSLTEEQTKLIDEINGDMSKLMEKRKELTAPKPEPKNYSKAVADLEEELSSVSATYNEMKGEVFEGVESAYARLTPGELAKAFDEKLGKIALGRSDMDNVANLMRETSDAIEKEDLSKWMTNARLANESNINELREAVSDYLFGRTDVIPRGIDPGKLEALTHAVKNQGDADRFYKALSGEMGGKALASTFDDSRKLSETLMEYTDPTDALRALVRQDSLVSDDMYEINKYLASKYGYGYISQVRDRINKIADELNINKRTGEPRIAQMTPEHISMYDEFVSLSSMLARRNKEYKRIMDIPNPADRIKEVRKLKDEQTADEMYEMLFGDQERFLKHAEGINDLSDTRVRDAYAGTKYNRELNVEDMSFADEAASGGRELTREQIELDRFRKGMADKDYTPDEIYAHSFKDIKAKILENRQRYLYNQSLTPQARESAKKLSALEGKYKRHVYRYKLAKENGASAKYLENIQKNARQTFDEIAKEKDRIARETNLYSVMEKAKNLTRDDVERISAQIQAGLFIQEKLFSKNTFESLTSKQKNYLTGLAYSLTNKYIKANGVPKKKDLENFKKFLESEGVKKINKETKRVVQERAQVMQETLVRDKVTYDSGVEVKIGDETVRGVVRKIIEEKEPIFRERVEKKLVPNGEGTIGTRVVKVPRTDKNGKPIIGKDGKPVMREKVENYTIPPARVMKEERIKEKIGEQGTGVFKYEVELADGTMQSVKASDIVGTYADEFHVEKVMIPRYTQEELDDMLEYMEKLKARIRATKGAGTRQEKKLARDEHLKAIKLERLDKQIAELATRKSDEEKKLAELLKVESDATAELKRLEESIDLSASTTTGYDTAYNKLMERHEQINKALDDNELFETMVKLDMGEDGWAEFLKNSEEVVAKGDLMIDRIADYDKHIVDIAKKIRHDFVTAGMDEVAVGKLDEGALRKMIDQYFPRSLSVEGKAFFDKNPELIEKYTAVAREYGFGREFSPFSRARSDESRYKSIFQLNDELQSELGVRVFEENLGQAYINRMLTSTDMVYDQRAMMDLMFRFGHGLENGIKEGYEAVINYGMLKDFVRNLSIKRVTESLEGRKVEREVFDEMFKREAESIMDAMSLNRSILDGETTPLIKLEPEHAEQLYAAYPGLVRQVNSVTIDRANQSRQLIMERDEKRMLQLYDKFMTFFKLNQTTVMPAFHVRNHLGAMFVGWLGVGREALDLKAQKRAYEALKSYGDITALRNLRPISPDSAGGKTYYWDEIMDMANTYRVIDEGFMAKDFASHSYSKGTRIIPGKFDPFNTRDFLPYKIGSKIATYSDNINRVVQFSALLKQGKTPLEASEIVRKYMFDYSDLTTFEKRWMKRIFPYYTYMRKNLPLMSNQFLENSEKMQFVGKIHNGIEGMATDEEVVGEQYKMGFAEDWLSMPFKLNGSVGEENVLFNPNMPYMQLRDLPTGQDLGDTARTFFSQTAPMLKVPIELATNWNSFFDAPLTTPEGDQVSPKVLHVMSQLAAFNAARQFVTASTMDDRVLSLINTGTGVKMTTYDLESAKEQIYEQAYENEFKLSLKNILGSGVRFANDLVDNTKANISDMAVSLYGRPYDAFDAQGALAPISQTAYKALSEEDKKLYTLDEETKSYLNNRAIEFEREQYEKSGVMKKFAWTLVQDKFKEKAVVHVDRVVDGDTFVARQGEETYNVRLLLVDTPESKGDFKDNPQYHSIESANYTKDLILGKDVKLYIDENTTYGRRLAFVEVGGSSVQEKLVEDGIGKVRLYDENYTDEANELYNLEEDAYNQRKGIWRGEGNAVPRSNSGFIR